MAVTVALVFGRFKGEWRVEKRKRAHRGGAVGALYWMIAVGEL